MPKVEKEIEKIKFTIYNEFKRKQEENHFLPPWDGTKMLLHLCISRWSIMESSKLLR